MTLRREDNAPGGADIVLAAFGTADPAAARSLLAVRSRAAAAFPGCRVRLAFTSGMIRARWRGRAGDADFREGHPDLPAELYSVPGVLSALAAAQEEGPRPVLVQSLHVTDGEEFTDLKNLVQLLGSYETAKPGRKPFPAIGLGGPALGEGDGEDGRLRRAAEALRPLVERAGETDAALVLAAHGNERLDQSVFEKFEQTLRRIHGPRVHIGTVEARPLAADVVRAVRSASPAPGRVLLAPLMLAAGEHAANDVFGADADSWRSRFLAAGFAVERHAEGLGSNPAWADIYVESLKGLEQILMPR